MLFTYNIILYINCTSTKRKLKKKVWQFLKKLKIKLPYYPAILLLGIHPRKIKTYVHTRTCSIIPNGSIIHNNQNWKQFKYSSTEEIHKWNVIHKMKFHPTIKRKEPVIQHGWLNLTNIMLSERSQTPKITFIFTYQKSRKQISDCLEQREEAGIGYKWIQENILEGWKCSQSQSW